MNRPDMEERERRHRRFHANFMKAFTAYMVSAILALAVAVIVGDLGYVALARSICAADIWVMFAALVVFCTILMVRLWRSIDRP